MTCGTCSAGLVALTVTPGSTAPLSSVTRPMMLAPVPCAAAGAASSPTKRLTIAIAIPQRARNRPEMLRIYTPLSPKKMLYGVEASGFRDRNFAANNSCANLRLLHAKSAKSRARGRTKRPVSIDVQHAAALLRQPHDGVHCGLALHEQAVHQDTACHHKA